METLDLQRTSPIHQIPVEVLQKIFILAVRPHEVVRLASPKLPWILSHVCRGWRDVTLSVSSLWGQITLHSWSNDRPQSTFARVQALLERSRKALLFIYIEACFRRNEQDILQLLAHHSERWYMLAFKGILSSLSPFNQVRGRIPSLIFLELDAMYTPTVPFFQDTFEIAPRLRTVCLRGGELYEPALPWSSITTYKDTRGKFPDRFGLWQNMVRIHLRSLHIPESDIIPRSTCSLPTVRIMEISFHDTLPSSPYFFERVSFPNLQVFSVSRPPPGLVQAFITMIEETQSSSAQLEYLTFLHTDFAPCELTALLLSTPCLKALHLPVPPIEDLRVLAIPPMDGGLVPMLEKLVIEPNGTDLDGGIVHDITLARCGHATSNTNRHEDSGQNTHPATLKTFVIKFDSRIGCLAQLEQLYLLFHPDSANLPDHSDALVTSITALVNNFPEYVFPGEPDSDPDSGLKTEGWFANIEENGFTPETVVQLIVSTQISSKREIVSNEHQSN